MENNNISGKQINKSLSLIIVAITLGNVFFVVTGGPALTGFTRSLGAGDLFQYYYGHACYRGNT